METFLSVAFSVTLLVTMMLTVVFLAVITWKAIRGKD